MAKLYAGVVRFFCFRHHQGGGWGGGVKGDLRQNSRFRGEFYKISGMPPPPSAESSDNKVDYEADDEVDYDGDA